MSLVAERPCRTRHADPRPDACPYCRMLGRHGLLDGIDTRTDNRISLPSVQRPECLHLGVRTEFREGCGGWKCVHACDLGHVEAVPGGSCQSCHDHAAHAAGVEFGPDSTPSANRPRGWQDRPSVKAAHWSAANAFLSEIEPYPSGRFSGRGVVIAGGGKYWPSVYVTVRMLRHVGCSLPVEVWHLGERERDDRFENLLAPLRVRIVDADSHPARPTRRIVNGFEVKLFAAMHSAFEQVLYLDADCYPCVDPTPLFDEPRFRETGGVYWPDLKGTEAWTKWQKWGVEPYGPNCGFETGVYMIDKQIAWKPLRLAEWYDDHSDWCYGFDYGDKGPHRVAWAKFRKSPTVFNPVATWKHPAFLQPGPDGRTPAFVHRCRSKFVIQDQQFYTPQSGLNQRGGLPLEQEAFAFLDGLRESLSRMG